MEIGPVWAVAIMGAESAPAATAAPLRRLRRRGDLLSDKVSLQSWLNFQAQKFTAWFLIMQRTKRSPFSENPRPSRHLFQIEMLKC
jgi:hypothetical protein